ncbi:MAG: selenoneine biosynthesis selenosugar synthase SenB [Acidobacteriota bacterium]
MRIQIVTPAAAGTRYGNRITAHRWARILRSLAHSVAIRQEYRGEDCRLLVALHARRSANSIRRFRQQRQCAPLVVALTGTDVYRDIHIDSSAQCSLQLASRLIVLQPLAIQELARDLRHKTRVIYQSVKAPSHKPAPSRKSFSVCVLGHLRPVKDPFRAARASRLLPAASRIRVIQVGAAMSEEMAVRARAEADQNPRYDWLGELPRWKALRRMWGCRLLVLSSRLEGGANVISEAIAASVPVLSSHINGSIGLLGPDYPGYFPVEDSESLAALLWRAETEPGFYQELARHIEDRGPLVEPERERDAWGALLNELGVEREPS